MKIGVIGGGFVGNATKLFECESPPVQDVHVLTYDKDPEKCCPVDTSLPDLVDCDLVFICVPTPMNEDGSCHTQIVENCIHDLKAFGLRPENIVVRSTVPVGFCKSMGVNFMPEFLTESNWKEDFKNNNTWIFGLHDIEDTATKNKFISLIILAKKYGKILYNDKYFCTNSEAELIKLTRNCFLACKVSFFNEIYDFAFKNGCNYEVVSNLVGLDRRIGESHTKVPGPDGEKGYGGTCFPKDLNSLLSQFCSIGLDAPILRAAKFRNEHIDRPKQDWKNNKGRAVI